METILINVHAINFDDIYKIVEAKIRFGSNMVNMLFGGLLPSNNIFQVDFHSNWVNQILGPNPCVLSTQGLVLGLAC